MIEHRLKALDQVDKNVVELLEVLGNIFEIYTEPSQRDFEHATERRGYFDDSVKTFYGLLSDIAISLRKEVKSMDENIGTFNSNESSMMVLPVSVEKKNTILGDIKLETELKTTSFSS